MARANAVRGSEARITVRFLRLGQSGGTIRHPAAEASAAAAALRVPTKETSFSPAVSSGATPLTPFSPSPSYVEPSHSANSRTRIGGLSVNDDSACGKDARFLGNIGYDQTAAGPVTVSACAAEPVCVVCRDTPSGGTVGRAIVSCGLSSGSRFIFWPVDIRGTVFRRRPESFQARCRMDECKRHHFRLRGILSAFTSGGGAELA